MGWPRSSQDLTRLEETAVITAEVLRLQQLAQSAAPFRPVDFKWTLGNQAMALLQSIATASPNVRRCLILFKL